MKKHTFSFLFSVLLTLGMAQDSLTKFSLKDYFIPNPALDVKVNLIFQSLSDSVRVGQMIMPAAGRLGKSTEHVARLVAEQKVGGVLLLNGTKDQFTDFTRYFDSISLAGGGQRLFFTADAELSLINMKIKETQKVLYANKIKDSLTLIKESGKVADELTDMGVNWDFAPVVDLSPNKTVSFRSFGLDKDTIISFSTSFIETLQDRNILATAKHFPGHGYVKGDTHKQLVFIDGEMKEVEVYVPLIKAGVGSIMIGHIAVKNNTLYSTDGLPSSVSKKIVTDLLRNEMGFEGLIVTDAMGMGGVVNVPHNCLEAAKAGCDVILMPRDEDVAFQEIYNELKVNEVFKEQVYASVKRIIRMKICLGIIE